MDCYFLKILLTTKINNLSDAKSLPAKINNNISNIAY